MIFFQTELIVIISLQHFLSQRIEQLGMQLDAFHTPSPIPKRLWWIAPFTRGQLSLLHICTNTHTHLWPSLLSSSVFSSKFWTLANKAPLKPHCFCLCEHKCQYTRVLVCPGVPVCLRVHICLLVHICSMWISQEQQQGKWAVKVSGLLRINRNSLINHPAALSLSLSLSLCLCVSVRVCVFEGI